MFRILIMLFTTCALGFSVTAASAAQTDTLQSPAAGVLCDQYFCANSQGISNDLTAQYLGQATAQKLMDQGDFNRSAFTFSNKVFCDVSEQRCYADRYYNTKNGNRRSVQLGYTTTLFGGPSLKRLNK